MAYVLLGVYEPPEAAKEHKLRSMITQIMSLHLKFDRHYLRMSLRFYIDKALFSLYGKYLEMVRIVAFMLL